ncbi:MAG: DUF308 domain-containing protein [Eubacteriales bacterium]|nr:DUF308 domain-containing protein [Lachnospiraceae bacterium]MDO5126191.1 DUF308 domain-containing protein [Eubacteriales bacterium]
MGKKNNEEVMVGEVVEEAEKSKAKALFNKFKSHTLFRAAVMMVAGLVLIIFPSATQRTIAYIVSVVLVVFGVVHLLRYFKKTDVDGDGIKDANSPFDLILGVVLIVLAGLVAKLFISFIPIVLGIFIIISGLLKLEQGFTLKRAGSADSKFVMIVAGVTIVVGLLAVFNPFATGNVLLMILGAGMLFSGITDLIAAGQIAKVMKLKDDDLSKF